MAHWIRTGVIAFAALGCGAPVFAMDPHDCASSVAELRRLAGDPLFAARWEETSMLDGKPLLVSITEREGRLFLAFFKTHEGVWAEGPVAICAASTELEARIAKSHIVMGPAAHWLLRQSLGNGATFSLRRLASGQLRIATPGWSGVFSPRHE